VLVCDNLVPHEHRPFDGAFTQWMLRNSDGYLVMSDSVERDLDRLKPGAPRRRVAHPLYAQFDQERWTRETARARLGLEGEVVLFFGYIRRYKGLDPLLEAWREARARRPAATLVVAGEPYEDVAPYRRLAERRENAGVRMLDRYIPDEGSRRCSGGRRRRAALPLGDAGGVTHVAYALGVP
jgi:glycosyltransferase involved in cell wall biosynthesis